MRLILITLICFSGISCKKYLDEKQDKSTATIRSIQDLQSILDDDGIMNRYYPSVIAVANADEYYLTSANWAYSNSLLFQPLYIWNDTKGFGWEYQVIFQADVVLEELDKINISAVNQLTYNNIKGQALFFRSFNFQQLADLFCKPYSSTAATDLGIPLRLTSDFNVKSVRSTVQQTYDQIINDLREAATLLPENNIAITRPNKAAAYAALARTYLSMRDYVSAGLYADSSLQRKNALMDYNTLNAGLATPISELNPENIFLCYTSSGITIVAPYSHIPIDTSLYNSYANNDLRKSVFFQQQDTIHYFKGYYALSIGSQYFFNGLATDEMYLTRAECAARADNKDSAMADLNRLMIKRWNNNGSWVPFTATDGADALNKILTERKKELVFRGLRWSDLRRLNLEGANITLTRIIDGITYTLPSNDPRWVSLIPPDVISLTGMRQNPR